MSDGAGHSPPLRGRGARIKGHVCAFADLLARCVLDADDLVVAERVDVSLAALDVGAGAF
jgi:hypothetical protein